MLKTILLALALLPPAQTTQRFTVAADALDAKQCRDRTYYLPIQQANKDRSVEVKTTGDWPGIQHAAIVRAGSVTLTRCNTTEEGKTETTITIVVTTTPLAGQESSH